MKSNFTIIFEKNGKPDPKPKRGKSLSLGNLSDFKNRFLVFFQNSHHINTTTFKTYFFVQPKKSLNCSVFIERFLKSLLTYIKQSIHTLYKMSRSRTFIISIENCIESDWVNICNFVKDGKAEYIVVGKDNNTIKGFIRFNSAKTISAVSKNFVKITTIGIEVNKDVYYKGIFSKCQYFYEDGAPAQNNRNLTPVIKADKKQKDNEILLLENKEKIQDLENLVKGMKHMQAAQLDCVIQLLDDSNNQKLVINSFFQKKVLK